jgi:aminopeptidase YwaD
MPDKMKNTHSIYLAVYIFLFISGPVNSQFAWYDQWGLLPGNVLDYFIGESSGERTYNHIAELSVYNRKRTAAEYTGTLMEAQYVADKIKEYGLTDGKIERFGTTNTWKGITGTLWEVSPNDEKIADFSDLPFLLAKGSQNADVEADLVYIGDADNGDLDKMDLTGKIILTSSRPGAILNMILQKGVIGFVSYYSPRPLENSIMVPDVKGESPSGESQSTLFGFNIPPRDGQVLRGRLLRGEKIRVHAVVKKRTEELDIQVPTCMIPGTDPQAGEVIITAHLFEGYGVQGANDNISGASAILEAARVIRKLITDGSVERPKRTIRFIWVPEFSGTIPYVRAHKDIIKKTLCNINLDMVGLSLSKYKSSFILHRTSYGNAYFIGDVLENYYRYVGETNQINSVVSGTRFFKRIVAPTGTDDPFYYQIETSSGGSDHDVFNDWGIQVPGVLMITWPDPFYHTSQDRVDKCDPTQLKRAVFIAAVSAYTIASAGEDEALNIAGEVYGNSTRRLGYQVSKSFDELNKSGADRLEAVLKRAAGNIRGVALGEGLIIKSILDLSPASERLKDLLERQAKSLNDMSEAQINNLILTAGYRASDFGMQKLNMVISKEEKIAADRIPSVIIDLKELGYQGYTEMLNKLPDEIRNKYKVSGVPDVNEAAKLINGKNSLLDIKYMVDAQYSEETSLEGLAAYFNLLKEAGIIRF